MVSEEHIGRQFTLQPVKMPTKTGTTTRYVPHCDDCGPLLSESNPASRRMAESVGETHRSSSAAHNPMIAAREARNARPMQ